MKNPITSSDTFDPQLKETELRNESSAWDTSAIHKAAPDDIPIIDLTDYCQDRDDTALELIAAQLREACTRVGFCSIVGHQFPQNILRKAFAEARRFHALPLEQKNTLAIGFEIEIASFNIGPRGKKELHAAILPYPSLGLFSHALYISIHYFEYQIDMILIVT